MYVKVLEYKNGVLERGKTFESDSATIGWEGDYFNIDIGQFHKTYLGPNRVKGIRVLYNEFTLERVLENISHNAILVVKLSKDSEKVIVAFKLTEIRSNLVIEETIEDVIKYTKENRKYECRI